MLMSSIFFAKSIFASNEKKCRILMLKGGGIHGAYESGVLKSIVEQMPAEDIKYDYVSGVSIGAVNASFIALFPPGQEKEAAEGLWSKYDGHSSADIMEPYTPSILAGFFHNSLLDSTKFKDQIEEFLADSPFKRKLSLISTNLLNG